MRDAIKGMKQKGVCPEDYCPFPDRDLITQATANDKKRAEKWKILNSKPKATAFENALPHRIARYKRLDADEPEDGAHAWDDKLTYTQKAAFGQYNLDMLRSCLSEGWPVAFSFWYYLPDPEMFEDKNGKHTIKDIWNDEKCSDKGKFPRHTWVKHLKDPFTPKNPGDGHSVLAVGYDDTTPLILVQNSRGSEWGNHGYFYMPYAWIS